SLHARSRVGAPVRRVWLGEPLVGIQERARQLLSNELGVRRATRLEPEPTWVLGRLVNVAGKVSEPGPERLVLKRAHRARQGQHNAEPGRLRGVFAGRVQEPAELVQAL